MYRSIKPGLLLLSRSVVLHPDCSALRLLLSFRLYTIPGLARSTAGSGVPKVLNLRMHPGNLAHILPVKYHCYKNKPVAEWYLHEYHCNPDPGP
ncbi:hypothetical protein D3C80_1447420 [compost metagenome]